MTWTSRTERLADAEQPRLSALAERPRVVAAPERTASIGRRLWRVSWPPAAIYLVSRAVVVLTMGLVAVAGGGSLGGRIDRWDSVWYLRVTSGGYPSRLPVGHGHVLANTIAFFPGLPLLIRGLSGLTHLSQFSSGVIVSSVTGLTATIGVWALVREFVGERTANRLTVLFAFFPGSFVFSMIYSEGLVITGAAFGLLALLRRRWVLAGLLGLVATSAAPIALAFVLSCAWAAAVAIRSNRDWRALAAPLLAPLGTLIYLGWTWQHTGTLAAFSRTERGGWRSFLSIAYPFRILWQNIAHPITTEANQRMVFFCIIVVAAAIVIALRDRLLPNVVLVYGVAVGVLAMLTAPVGPRPRIILDAFPLILAVGLRYQEGWKYKLAAGLSVALLVPLTIYTVGSTTVFP